MALNISFQSNERSLIAAVNFQSGIIKGCSNGSMIEKHWIAECCVVVSFDQTKDQEPFSNERIDAGLEYERFTLILKTPGVVCDWTHKSRSSIIESSWHKYPDSVHLLRRGLVHRLDKATSGILILAKTNLTTAILFESLKIRKIRKLYVAVIKGDIKSAHVHLPLISPSPGLIGIKKSGISSFTKVMRVKAWRRASLLSLIPMTGRTHQLRVHCSSIGSPIVGDRKYGKGNGRGKLGMLLHAALVVMRHPTSLRRISITSSLPIRFYSFIKTLDTINCI